MIDITAAVFSATHGERMTTAALEMLDDGRVPKFGILVGKPDDPTPTFDALVREFATGRDASGRFVRRWVA